ncbi:bifunctional metallophosphatase/5'-nucleotidase [Georgenia sp. M64]|uniref:bifunctional metallophosphatase/5'-nucleotidase n=1 Tax=Georgenia sp. M64 TaxID=3120520 RepID=UPI0030E5E1E0
MAELTIVHVGDLHGHLVPRPNLRGDGTGRAEGGLAHLAALLARIRAERPATLLANTGDTIQGSAEALFTRGQALVDVVDRLGVDLFAPGNWDYLYGKERFLELFGPGTGSGPSGTRWGAVAANAYHAGTRDLLLPPYLVTEVAGLRVGVVGLSSERAINALGPWVTEGIEFTDDAHEVPAHVRTLREDEGADLVVLVSEFGLAKNVLIAETNPGIDVVLSSDMHEETRECVVTSTGALVSEVGQDGTRLARLDLTVEGGRVTGHRYRLHTVDAGTEPDPDVARLVEEVRAPFLAGAAFRTHVNPLNGAVLDRPIDDVIGRTEVGLHRSGFCGDGYPAAVEGTSHDFLSAAIREVAGTDVGHLRGFRYGTHVAPGPIRLEDLYHYLPVGAQLARTTVTGEQLRQSLEGSADGTFNPDPFRWTGGWVHAYAGVRYALDVYADKGSRISAVQVRRGDGDWADLEPGARYTLAGYWYPKVPDKVGGIDGGDVTVLGRAGARARGSGGAADGPGTADVVDVTEHVVDHLARHVVRAEEPRVRLVRPLPDRLWSFPEIQPLRGARQVGSSPRRATPR